MGFGDRLWRALGAGLGCGLGLVTFGLSSPTLAVRFADGTVAFDHLPSFFGASTPYPDTWVSGTTYFFKLQVPANAGEPLQRIEITQQAAPETIQFIPEATRAYIGRSQKDRLGLGKVTFQEQTLTVNFDPPVPPGTLVTLAVSPEQNPQFAGVYLFSVTVFPAGEKVRGQMVGTGRLQFYRGDDW
ncbi:MAG: DUF2808 domain-containing protein [Aphanocapsa sp. GSE-SYN-MK-11-07L]|jgi:hypothetical protein|nr:DUF2808 domain-containing protein [Aphanocapsa sp. GSE-SYN-MK-11-07L]